MEGMAATATAIWGNHRLRSIVGASVAYGIAEMAIWTAILVFAYAQGGAAAAGVAGVAQLIPAALGALVGGAVADRANRGRVLVWIYALLGVLAGALGVVVSLGATLPVVIVFGALISVPFALVRPLQSSIVPGVAQTPTELVAVNGALGFSAATSYVLGPLVAGVLLNWGAAPVFWAMLGVLLVGSALIRPLWTLEDREYSGHDHPIQGLLDLVATKGAGMLLMLGAIYQFTVGGIEILFVAWVIDGLGLSDSAVGYVAAVAGVGGMVGASWVFGLAGRRRLTGFLVGAAIAWSVPIALLGFVPGLVVGGVLVFVSGIGELAFDTMHQTLLQRVAPPHLMSRAFGAAEALRQASIGVGALVVGMVTAQYGLSGGAMLSGFLLPVAVLVTLDRLRKLDGGVDVPWDRVETLRDVELFAGLSTRILEDLAETSLPVVVETGEVLIEEGAEGDCCFVVASGNLAVSKRDRTVATLGVGSLVGEIALLRSVPRTADVVALSDATVLRIDRAPFLTAISGNRVVVGVGDHLADRRLGELDDLD